MPYFFEPMCLDGHMVKRFADIILIFREQYHSFFFFLFSTCSNTYVNAINTSPSSRPPSPHFPSLPHRGQGEQWPFQRSEDITPGFFLRLWSKTTLLGAESTWWADQAAQIKSPRGREGNVIQLDVDVQAVSVQYMQLFDPLRVDAGHKHLKPRSISARVSVPKATVPSALTGRAPTLATDNHRLITEKNSFPEWTQHAKEGDGSVHSAD